MKILDALRLQPLTSEPYCPCAADEHGVFDSVARLGGGGALGASGDKLLEMKKGPGPPERGAKDPARPAERRREDATRMI
jgi:hypothetical protein